MYRVNSKLIKRFDFCTKKNAIEQTGNIMSQNKLFVNFNQVELKLEKKNLYQTQS
jgi:hypothetical protein